MLVFVCLVGWCVLLVRLRVSNFFWWRGGVGCVFVGLIIWCWLRLRAVAFFRWFCWVRFRFVCWFGLLFVLLNYYTLQQAPDFSVTLLETPLLSTWFETRSVLDALSTWSFSFEPYYTLAYAWALIFGFCSRFVFVWCF